MASINLVAVISWRLLTLTIVVRVKIRVTIKGHARKGKHQKGPILARANMEPKVV